jgi:hypothetical protein
MECFFFLYQNQHFIVGSTLRLVGGFITADIAEMDFQNILYQRHVALPIENVAMTKGCMLLRYQIYILTSCEFVDDLQMGISIDFGNHGCACRFPYSL